MHGKRNGGFIYIYTWRSEKLRFKLYFLLNSFCLVCITGKSLHNTPLMHELLIFSLSQRKLCSLPSLYCFIIFAPSLCTSNGSSYLLASCLQRHWSIHHPSTFLYSNVRRRVDDVMGWKITIVMHTIYISKRHHSHSYSHIGIHRKHIHAFRYMCVYLYFDVCVYTHVCMHYVCICMYMYKYVCV